MKYCIDSSSLITAWRINYPYENFESLWNKISELMDSGQIIAPMEVYEELKKGNDDLYKWIRKRKKIFQEISEDNQYLISEILTKFPKLIEEKNPSVQADPMVIALAKTTKTIVITEEKPDSAKKKKTKIPTVCNDYKIPYQSLVELIKQEKWKF